MSLPILQSLSEKYDISINVIEHYWNEAKNSLKSDDLSDKDYRYIYEIVKEKVMKKVLSYRRHNNVNEDTNNDTAKCPECGTEYLVNTGYCVSCDKKVAEPVSDSDNKKDERYRKYEANETKKCPDCGNKYLIKTGYCVSCKKKVADPVSDSKKKDTKKERVRYTIPMSKRSRINRIVEGFKDDYAKEPDWKSLEKQLTNTGRNGFDVFSYRDELGIEEVADALKNGSWDEIFERVGEYVAETAGVIVNELLEEEDFDINDVRENFNDELSELFYKAEELAVYNIEDIMPNELFFYDVDAIEIPDYTSLYTEDGELVEEAEEFIAKAKKFGFSEKDAVSVIENSSYGGMGGVGIIVEGSELAEAIKINNYKLDGNAILYIHDGYNGSGDYCMGKKFITIDYKNNKTAYENMDYGKYSLGDVFGTSDWSY